MVHNHPNIVHSAARCQVLYRAGLALELVASLSFAGAALILLLQALLEVTAESVVYTPGQGAVLTAHRRLGPKPVPRVLPLERLEGLVLEKVWGGGWVGRKETGRGAQAGWRTALRPLALRASPGLPAAAGQAWSATLFIVSLQVPSLAPRSSSDALCPSPSRAPLCAQAPVAGTQQTVLAYALKPAASKSGSGKGGKPIEEAFQEAELLFPNLQPPVQLLRTARDVLAPLLDADLAGGAGGAQRSRRAATAAPRQEGMKKDK